MPNVTKNLRQAVGRDKPRLTKKAQLIRMLSAKSGADAAAVSRKLGWQAHTTRAAITGLRKSGFQISSEKRENSKGRSYRIIMEPEASSIADEPPAKETKKVSPHAG